MGRVKQTAQRSQFAVAEEEQERSVAEPNNVKTKNQDVEMETHDQRHSSTEVESDQDIRIDNDKEFDAESTTQDDAGMSDSDGFVDNYDATDEDFEDEDSEDSEYEENQPNRRRRNVKPAMPNKSSKPKTAGTLAKRSKPSKPSSTSSSTISGKKQRNSRANSSGQAPRALRKAHRDIERRLSRGQPNIVDDRALRCLPYRTLNRAAKRELIRWNDDTYMHTLLALSWVLEVREIDVPWDEVAAVVHPGATGEAFKQALMKLRAKRLKDGLRVPPLRPGKEKSRKKCEEELNHILSMAQDARARIAGGSGITSKSSASTEDDSSDNEEDMETDREAQVSRKRPVEHDEEDDTVVSSANFSVYSDSSPSSSGYEADVEYPVGEWLHNITADSPPSSNAQVVTGRLKSLNTLPFYSVRRVQDNTHGLQSPIEATASSPIEEDSDESTVIEHMGALRRGSSANLEGQRSSSSVNRTRKDYTGMQAVHQLTSTAASSHPVGQQQNVPFAPVTPPSRLRTPTECPPAPRSSTQPRKSNFKKRSGEVLSAESSPAHKRHTSDAARILMRRASVSEISQIPPVPQVSDHEPYFMSPSLATPQAYGQGLMGGMAVPPFGYGDMDNSAFQPVPTLLMQQQMMNAYQQGTSVQQTSSRNPLPNPWMTALHQQQPAFHQLAASTTTHVNPMALHNIYSGGALSHSGVISHTSGVSNADGVSHGSGNATYPIGSQSSAQGLNQQRLPTAFGTTHNRRPVSIDHEGGVMTSSFTSDRDFFNRRNNNTPSTNPRIARNFSDGSGYVPFQNLTVGDFSEDPRPNPPPDQMENSQNTSSFDQSTQDSLGNNIQGSRVTPSQPQADPSTDEPVGGAQE